jgi:uncharacterized membrane protein YhaH (DUF805 family)
MLGTGTELLLVEHTEDVWQVVPLVLLGLGVVVMTWCLLQRRRAAVRTLRGVTVLLALSGFVGLYQHYQANAEFELEMYPTLGGLALFWKAIHGTSPAVMIGLGLLGLLSTYRHPALHDTGDLS